MARDQRNSKKRDFNKKSGGGKKTFQGKKVAPKKQSTPKKASNPNEIRLNKYISNSGICSRRDADMHISIGSVTVNGKVVTEMGYKVLLTDEVRFDGKLIHPEEKAYVLLNKPKGFLCTTNDEKNRRTVMELVANATRSRILPVGRLERQTTGLLLFTNDGELAKKLTESSSTIRQLYHIELDRNLSQADYNKIKDGLRIEGVLTEVNEISWVQGTTKREVGIKILSSKNGVIKRIFEHLKYEIVRQDRVIYTGLTKKDLPRGHWRHLTQQEIINLKML